MWFTDNGRDMLGDNTPPCELNHANRSGMHFGYPYCHGGNVEDPVFGKKQPCDDFTAPALSLGPHVAPLGLKFYTGKMFPEKYRNSILIAEHGSWNRSKKIGYRVMFVKIVNNKAVSYEPFATGWLDDSSQRDWGRPVDILELPDGSILLSDDKAGLIYRIVYKK
jgi:glucose/arabinose dehydrogenase